MPRLTNAITSVNTRKTSCATDPTAMLLTSNPFDVQSVSCTDVRFTESTFEYAKVTACTSVIFSGRLSLEKSDACEVPFPSLDLAST